MERVKKIINPEEKKSTGRVFMNYYSRIIVGIYSYLQEHDDKEIEDLFSYAVDVFNALGSWVYGGCSPKIAYPNLQLFVKKSNISTTESFSHLLYYINWASNKLYKSLEENHWIQEYYYESFTLEQNNDTTTGLFLMWRLGWLIVSKKDISKENNISSLPPSFIIFDTLFDAFGGWIFNQVGLNTITQGLQEFERILEGKFDPIYDELLEEANKTKSNIKKFLQNL